MIRLARPLHLLSVLVLACAAVANPVKPYAEALKDGKDILVLCVGTGWMIDCEKYKSAFRTAAQGFSGDVVWALYDRPAGLSSEEANALGKLPCEVYGYPCLVYRDSEGRPLFQQEGIRLEALQKLGPLATRTLKIRNDRDIALKAARAMTKGRAKAAALGKALAPILDPVLGTYSERAIGSYQQSVRDIVREIREADPLDHDGWAFKYTFCYLPIVEGMSGKSFNEKFESIKDWLTKDALLPVQRQQLYCMLFKTELDEAGEESDEEETVSATSSAKSVKGAKKPSMSEAIKALNDGIAVDPKSPLADAMRNMVDYYTKPVRLTRMRWLGKDNRPRWQKAVLDCASVVKVGGLYRVEFKPRAGGTRFRKVRFAGGSVGVQKGSNVWVCRFPGEDKPVLEMELKGSGWFDGNGDIVITGEK